MDYQTYFAIARGEEPADLLLTDVNVVNTFTGRIKKTNVAICQDRIAGVGDYQMAREVIELDGRYLSPGFIDGHIHLESSMLSPGEYAKAVVPRGVLGVVTDFHEMANVCGVSGIEYYLKYSEAGPDYIKAEGGKCVKMAVLWNLIRSHADGNSD